MTLRWSLHDAQTQAEAYTHIRTHTGTHSRTQHHIKSDSPFLRRWTATRNLHLLIPSQLIQRLVWPVYFYLALFGASRRLTKQQSSGLTRTTTKKEQKRWQKRKWSNWRKVRQIRRCDQHRGGKWANQETGVYFVQAWTLWCVYWRLCYLPELLIQVRGAV